MGSFLDAAMGVLALGGSLGWAHSYAKCSIRDIRKQWVYHIQKRTHPIRLRTQDFSLVSKYQFDDNFTKCVRWTQTKYRVAQKNHPLSLPFFPFRGFFWATLYIISNGISSKRFLL